MNAFNCNDNYDEDLFGAAGAAVAGAGADDCLGWPTLSRQEQCSAFASMAGADDDDLFEQPEVTRRAMPSSGVMQGVEDPAEWSSRAAVAAALTSASADSAVKLLPQQHAMHELTPPAAPQYLLSGAMHLTTGAPRQLMLALREVAQTRCKAVLVERPSLSAAAATEEEMLLDFDDASMEEDTNWCFYARVPGRGGAESCVRVALYSCRQQRCLVSSDVELNLEVSTDCGDRNAAAAVRSILSEELRAAGVVVDGQAGKLPDLPSKNAAPQKTAAEEDDLAPPAAPWAPEAALAQEVPAQLPRSTSAVSALCKSASGEPAAAAGAVDWCKSADPNTATEGASVLSALAGRVESTPEAAAAALEAFQASGAMLALSVAASAHTMAAASALAGLDALTALSQAAGLRSTALEQAIAGAKQ